MSGVELGAAPAPEPSPVVVAAPEPEPVATVVEPGLDAAAEPEPVAAEPEPEPVAAAPEPKKQEPRGAVAELIARREEARLRSEEAKQLREQIAEYQRGIAEGRIIVKPQPTPADREVERLSAQAKELGLVREDGTPDLDAARKVDGVIRRTVQEVVAPIQQKAQSLEQTSMRERADQVMQAIWTEAQQQGVSQEALTIARQEFEMAMGQPNAEMLLANREVADGIFATAMGKAFRMGKLMPAAPAVKPKPAPTPAIITEAGGRRGPSAAAIQLPPAVAAVYRNAGIDPGKAPSASASIKVDPRGGVEIG